ncbi:hypothetical protein QFZ40_000754 [Arthrobacter pascens]|nr:hypothetical protein [Arthrobacter pascens]
MTVPLPRSLDLALNCSTSAALGRPKSSIDRIWFAIARMIAWNGVGISAVTARVASARHHWPPPSLNGWWTGYVSRVAGRPARFSVSQVPRCCASPTPAPGWLHQQRARGGHCRRCPAVRRAPREGQTGHRAKTDLPPSSALRWMRKGNRNGANLQWAAVPTVDPSAGVASMQGASRGSTADAKWPDAAGLEPLQGGGDGWMEC